MTLLELAAERGELRRHVRRVFGASMPDYWVDEIEGQCVVLIVSRHRRKPDDGQAVHAVVRNIVLDAARTATRPRRRFGYDVSVDVELADPPNQLRGEALQTRWLDEETEAQAKEWLSKPLTVRAQRAAESMKALGTSPAHHTSTSTTRPR